jgi:glycosyltransferase involved in cell wall biosynthesis
MHILFLIYSLAGGGAERVTVNLANHFVSNGHRVTIATLTDKDIPDKYALDEQVKRVWLGLAEEGRSLIHSGALLFRRVSTVRKLLRAEAPDAAIGMMTTSASLLALAGGFLPPKLVGAERTFPPAAPLPPLWRVLRRLAYRRLDLVVAQTRMMADWLEANTGATVTVIGNPWLRPNPDRSEAETPGPDAGNPPTILAAGRLAVEKRFDLLLEAFARCAGSRPEWRLVIAGNGPLRDELVHRAERLGIGERVHFPGRVDNLDDWYSASEIFVLSSEFEGFPNVLLEAMGHGMAVLSFDCPTGPRELIRNEENGLLAKHLDVTDLAAGLGRLMGDPALRQRLGQSATEVRNRLSIDRVAALWLAALE